ncbi:glutamate receptor ionotropic, kainate 1-like [Branchiostoma floridae]|uniref:Glutamate receptor ionotropic, kainate 1-like n=3 Tax=Branchiostoma floridae TaxID=7739 RepID=A0A9J7MI81_BRAFL|nr:glutamate receptor ionotropic, kainate 1-like [Branchiostoma floridae]
MDVGVTVFFLATMIWTAGVLCNMTTIQPHPQAFNVDPTPGRPLLLSKLLDPTKSSRRGEGISLRGKRLRAVTILEAPYMMKKENDKGEHEFSGFVKDIVDKLSENMRFDYEMYVVRDGTYGTLTENGTWTGLIGEVIEGRADVAFAPVTISSEREQVVDFTNPFMDLGAGLLLKKPVTEGTNVFAFLEPFRSTVWFSILGAIFGVAILLYVTSKLRYRCNVGKDDYDNDAKFNFTNSLWLTYWSIVRKGGEPAPRSLPSRILAGAWWFFTLIVISTYTANLTAFLTVKRLVSPIKSIDDLAGQTAIQYSVTEGTFLYSFFKSQEGTGSVYERMWYTMKANDRFPPTSMKGVDMVRSSHFALIEETPFLEYTVRTDEGCELMLLGKPFLFKGYGFSTKRGSPLKKPLSVGILKLQETGYMSELRDRWWPKNGCPLDGQTSNVDKASALGLEIFQGVFYVLGAAAVLAVLVTIVQVVYYRFIKHRKLPDATEDKKQPTHYRNGILRRTTTDVNLF